MNPTILALGAATLLAAMLPNAAEARCRGCGVAAGVVGGVAVGALIGSALARPAYDPPPPRYYVVEEEEPVCYIERRRVWIEGRGWRSRRVEICD